MWPHRYRNGPLYRTVGGVAGAQGTQELLGRFTAAGGPDTKDIIKTFLTALAGHAGHVGPAPVPTQMGQILG